MPKVPERLFVRPPWERMMHIHERIRGGTHPNSQILARELEVGPRTVKRDVDFMKCRLNLPIEYGSRRLGPCHGYLCAFDLDRRAMRTFVLTRKPNNSCRLPRSLL